VPYQFASNSAIVQDQVLPAEQSYQIEHHLFTGICHVHYKKIAPIVPSTIKEFDLPYHVQPTFLKELLEHARMLKKSGRP
jgi:linoleoyl-CoA desaturase